MANVLKLVYINKNLSTSQAWLASESNNHAWNSSSNDYYRSLVFTGDGHLLTHGLDFSSVASYELGLIYNSTAGNTASTAPLAEDGASIPVLTNNTDTNIIVSWTKLADLVTDTELNSWAGSANITTVGTIANGTWNGTVIDVAHGGTGTNSLTANQVLIGHGTNAVTTKAIDSTVTANSSNLITSGAVKAAIDDILGASNAMVFKGVLITNSDLPTSDYSAGWTYRVNTPGWIDSSGKLVNTKPNGSSIKVEVGDLIIAITDATTDQSSYQSSHWTVAQANIDGAVTAALALTSNALILGAGGQAITTLANGNSGLYLTMGSSSPTWASFLSLTIKDTQDTPTSLTYNPSAAKTLVFTGSATISGTSNDTITVTATNNTYSLITAKTATATDFSGSGTDTYLNLLTLENGSSSTVSSSIQLVGSGDATITLANQQVTIGSTPYTAAGGLNLSNHAFSLNVLGENETLSGNDVTGKAYAVALDDNGVPYVSVPWTDTNTWRPVNAYNLSRVVTSLDSTPPSTGTADLSFGSEFGYTENDTTLNNAEIHLVWAEVDSDGTITYRV